MRKWLISTLLISTLILGNSAIASQSRFSECLLPRSDWNIVSLGYPLASERLGAKTSIRAGVLPFRLSDDTSGGLTPRERSNYIQAASVIEKLSGNRVEVELIFFPTVNSKMRFSQAQQMVRQRDTGWRDWDLSKSTFGIVKEIVNNVDSLLDLSNLDTLILENKSRPFGLVAEAFQFFQSPPELKAIERGIVSGLDFKFHESISTDEGLINNAILFDSHQGTGTIVHELLHNFGLTDLYGGGSSSPTLYSIMASINNLNLLNYEKAVLGWFPTERVQCRKLSEIDISLGSSGAFEIKDLQEEHVVVIPVGEREGNIIEVRQDFNIPSLILYELKQDERPPIAVMGTMEGVSERLSLVDANVIGSILKSSSLQVMITNMVGSSVTVSVIPNSQAGSQEFVALKEMAQRNRENAISERQKSSNSEIGAKGTSKVKVLVCKKGSQKIKVKGKKPKCPAGFKPR